MFIKLTLEYEGTNYSGWQLQARHDTVQGRIERALAKIFSTLVRVYGSGRTDTGVHARGQVATIDLPKPFDLERLKTALNSMLPGDIVVLSAEPAPAGFDPRRSARTRVYEYRVLNRAVPSAFERRFSWLVREPLNLRAMNAAARVFIGEHDFVAFRKVGSAEKSTVRRATMSRWTREGDLLTYRIEANSFLRHQVRTMVSAMVQCGLGKLDADAVAAILASRDRGRAPASAPPQGLFLVQVRY
jgi:tRNA pseudouridine38-40 synthase